MYMNEMFHLGLLIEKLYKNSFLMALMLYGKTVGFLKVLHSNDVLFIIFNSLNLIIKRKYDY